MAHAVALVFWLALGIFVGTFFSRVRVAFAKRGFRFRRVRYTSLGTAILAFLIFSMMNVHEAPQKSPPETTAPAPATTTGSAAGMQKPLSSTERDAGIAAICITAADFKSSLSGKDPLDIAVDRAKAFAPSDSRMGYAVSHLLVYLYRRGPSVTRVEQLNQMARGLNNPKGVTPLTEASWTEADCAAAETVVGAPAQTPPEGSIGQVFASETR